MPYRLHRSITVPTTLERAWQFFSDPRNLATITPPSLGFRITSPVAETMYPGQIITYTVTPFPLLPFIPMTWVTEITHVQAPHYFVDEQRYGPYTMWHHQHHFKEVEGGVLVEDIVDYIMPGGPLGVIPHELLVKHELKKIFDYRTTVLERMFPRSENG